MTLTPLSPAPTQDEVRDAVHAVARQANVASRALARANRATKDAALHALADALVNSAESILEANALDVAREREGGMSPGLLDRLTLTSDRIVSISQSLRDVAGLPDPVGEIVRGSTLPNGLRVRQTRVPLGVVGVIYEARPNVTVDVAGLALKSGNAVILRGGSAAGETNTAIVTVLQEALVNQGSWSRVSTPSVAPAVLNSCVPVASLMWWFRAVARVSSALWWPNHGYP